MRGLINGVVVAVVAAAAVAVSATPALAADSTTNPTLSFASSTPTTSMGLTFDGTNYWSVSGGSPNGVREAQYTATGALVSTFSPGKDFRSISSSSSGVVYANEYSSANVYRQTTPGTFVLAATLTGRPTGSFDAIQAATVINEAGTGFLQLDGGVVRTWDLTGTPTASVTLQGYSAQSSPFSNRVWQVNGYYVTRASDKVISIWSAQGALVSTVALNVPGQTGSTGEQYSFSAGQGNVYLQVGTTFYVAPLYQLVTTATTPLSAGDSTQATARLVGGRSAMGTVAFSLYGPSDPTCSAAPISTSTIGLANSAATSTSYRVTQAGTYHWISRYSGDAQNAALSTTCASAPVTVAAGPLATLTLAPATASIVHGQSQTYTATGKDAFGNDLGTQTGVTYTIDGSACTANSCTGAVGTHTVTGTKGSATGTATLTVTPIAPTIATQPAATTAVTGADATFQVVQGGDPATTQWQVSSDAGATWADVPGATDPNFVLHEVVPGQDGQLYRAVLTNGSGTATSNPARLTVPPVTLTVTGPSGAAVAAGETIDRNVRLTVAIAPVATGSTYTVDVRSDPIRVGSMTGDLATRASTTFAVPAALDAGQHTIVIQDNRGRTISSFSFVVPPRVVPAAGSALARTGTDASGAGLLAVVLLVAGGVLLIVRARRRRLG